MLNFLICLIISILLGYGIAILAVEKGKDFPVKRIRVIVQLLLSKIYWKLPQMLFCTVCTSFWAALIADCLICLVSFFLFGIPYFFWPASGAITAGFTWTVIEFLNILDKEQNINIFQDKGEENED
jgi:hypothetical protein